MRSIWSKNRFNLSYPRDFLALRSRWMPKKLNLWMAVYPPRMAPFGFKLWENAFQTIPDISSFDGEQNFFSKTLSKVPFHACYVCNFYSTYTLIICFVFYFSIFQGVSIGYFDSLLVSPTGLRHVKRSVMSWVVAIPKEGRAFMAVPALLLIWHQREKIKKVGVIPKEGRPCALILILVWQRLRTLETFSLVASHIILVNVAPAGVTWGKSS